MKLFIIYKIFLFNIMIRHFFLDKTNTIYKKNPFNNVGLNPIMELCYGNETSRGLIHFDESEIMNLVEDKSFADLTKLSFKLKMTNCFSVDGYPYEKLLREGLNIKQRAGSFDLIALKLPCEFDEGRGFNFTSDFWIENNRSASDEGSSWNFAKTATIWPVDDDKINLEDKNLNFTDRNIWILSGDVKVKINLEGGVYSEEFIQEQINLYNSGETSLIVNAQHFDFGNENLSLDITNYVMDIINGERNFGLLIMFTPKYEKMRRDFTQYVSFFTDKTNTFFHPYIECIYDEIIKDDRATFCKGKENRLYLYTNINGIPVNLDNLPTCMINDTEYPTEQAQKGVYFAIISTSGNEMECGTIQYDKWLNLALNGEKIEDIEMDFEVQPMKNFVSIGNSISTKETLVPSVYGINDGESINRGEIREITVDFKKKYEGTKIQLIDNAEYRIYVKDGNREITVFDFTPIEKAFLKNFFLIHTEDLIPNNYYVDIRTKLGRELLTYKDVLRFKIVSDVTERYE